MRTSKNQIHSRIFVATIVMSIATLAKAQLGTDIPPAALPGTCKGVDFNRALLSSEVRVDLVAQVDEFGKAVSASPVAAVSDKALLAAVVSSLMTCKFQPALREGKPTPGTVRFVYQFSPAVSAKPLGRRPTITNVAGCAPKAEDYPPASRQLNETGTTGIRFTINPEGRLTAFGVVRSSGYLRLDYTALIKLSGCKFEPATADDGTPISASIEVEYVWKLE